MTKGVKMSCVILCILRIICLRTFIYQPFTDNKGVGQHGFNISGLFLSVVVGSCGQFNFCRTPREQTTASCEFFSMAVCATNWAS